MATLTIEHISKLFSTTKAVDDVSVTVANGELVCLLGPSGCGKSTVLRMVAGFETPTSGRILIDGEDVVQLTPERRPTGMVFQSHALWSHMNVAQNIAFGLKLRHLPAAAIREKVAGVLDLVGLAGYEKRSTGQLSGGQQQRVAIARCVVLEPKILLMDEPFSALDAHLRVRLREEVRAIQRRLGLTTIFVTHDQEEALTLADRVVVMKSGRVEQVGAPGNIYAKPATAFVAGFIGTMNVIDASLARGRTMIGPLALFTDAPDGACRIAIRPEDMLIGPPEQSALQGAIERIVDLGAFRMVDVRVAGHTIKVQAPKGQPLAIGDMVGLTIADAVLFDGDGTVHTVTVADPAAAVRPVAAE